MNVVFLGPPSSGKGTQAKRVAGELGLAHLATGDLLREEIGQTSALGLQAKGYMDRGELVPDDVVIGIVRGRLSGADQACVLFDGFPRTVAQAESLEQMLADLGRRIDRVVYLRVADEDLVRRAQGRRVCSNKDCQASYHLEFVKPRVPGRCDRCGSPLVQRDDDKPDTVRRRLREYQAKTAGLLDHYRGLALLVEVDGSRDLEAVTREILGLLQGAGC